MLIVLNTHRSVIHKLNYIFLAFLWGNKEGKKKKKWMAKDIVYRPTDEGGLGIRKLEDIEKALSVKFVCQFFLVILFGLISLEPNIKLTITLSP